MNKTKILLSPEIYKVFDQDVENALENLEVIINTFEELKFLKNYGNEKDEHLTPDAQKLKRAINFIWGILDFHVEGFKELVEETSYCAPEEKL